MLARYWQWPCVFPLVCLSVCLSVCHKLVLYWNGYTDRADCQHIVFPRYPGISKNKGTDCLLELCPKLWLIEFGHGTSTFRQCHKQATVVGLLLTTLGDGGRGQILLTANWRPSPVDDTQRPALCMARCSIDRARVYLRQLILFLLPFRAID